MNTRTWKRAGYVFAVIAVIMLTALTTLAYATDARPSPRFTVVAMMALIISVLAITLIVSAKLIEALDERIARFGKRIEEQGERYVTGVKDTVDRLAEALPSSKVRRIG